MNEDAQATDFRRSGEWRRSTCLARDSCLGQTMALSVGTGPLGVHNHDRKHQRNADTQFKVPALSSNVDVPTGATSLYRTPDFFGKIMIREHPESSSINQRKLRITPLSELPSEETACDLTTGDRPEQTSRGQLGALFCTIVPWCWTWPDSSPSK